MNWIKKDKNRLPDILELPEILGYRWDTKRGKWERYEKKVDETSVWYAPIFNTNYSFLSLAGKVEELRKRTDRVLNILELLMRHLGVRYQDSCSENLPKIIKEKKSPKKKGNKK